MDNNKFQPHVVLVFSNGTDANAQDISEIGLPIGESAWHGNPQPRSHVAGGGTSPKDFVCREGLQDEYEDQEKWNSHAKG